MVPSFMRTPISLGDSLAKTASSSCPMPGRQASIHNRQLRKSSRCLTAPPLRSAFLWSILTISGRTIMLYRGDYYMEIKLGPRIASLRKSKSMTQEQLALALGVSPPAVSKWETGVSQTKRY
mgnify:CR=1 FL=1